MRWILHLAPKIDPFLALSVEQIEKRILSDLNIVFLVSLMRCATKHSVKFLIMSLLIKCKIGAR